MTLNLSKYQGCNGSEIEMLQTSTVSVLWNVLPVHQLSVSYKVKLQCHWECFLVSYRGNGCQTVCKHCFASSLKI